MRAIPHSSRVPFLLFPAAAASAIGPIPAAHAQPAPSQPNIVLIFADDLGYGDLGCYGSPTIRTPHLDRLAREGVRFTDFYAAAPVCTPSRAALLTGRYPTRTGLTRILNPRSQDGIDADEITLAEVLRPLGYATACIGKWHLGHQPQYLPNQHGFDYFFGLPYSNDMVPTPLMRNGEVIEEPAEQDTLTRRYTEEAVAFIQRHSERPFFLYLPHSMPHVPLHASEAFRGRSPRGLYGDVVEEIDWSTGEILATLRELGREQDTLVVFTSDNGPWLIKGNDAGSAGHLRDGKGTVWEGGMREPMIACWPGVIPAGRVCRQWASTLDLFTTLLVAAGGQKPRDRIVDGRDITPLLTGTGAMPRADAFHPFFYHRAEQLEAVRVGNWKLHVGRDLRPLEQPELYDLAADPEEQHDLAAAYPEEVQALQKRIRWFQLSFAPAPVRR
ncbi:MAG: sulfatase [Armatimonadetes bacterium]|nr:sulfatase [Armatimonadota bacterium]